MPGFFIVGLLFIALAALLVFIGVFLPHGADASRDDVQRKHAWFTAAGTGAFGLLIWVLCSLTVVGTQDVGVVTSFGRPVGQLDNGLHFVAPWQKVTAMDRAIQTDAYTGAQCLNVRIANQQTACVDVTIRWRIKESAADKLFQNYHTFQNVQDSLVTRELSAAVNYNLSTFNPLNSISLNGGVDPSNGTKPNPTLGEVAASVTATMKSDIGQDIDVLTTIIPIITFDPETQSRINQLQQQIALTRIAEQQIVTNQAQAQANKALAGSIKANPNVLVAQCLAIMANIVKAGDVPPIGMNCGLGGSTVGGLIVNSGK